MKTFIVFMLGCIVGIFFFEWYKLMNFTHISKIEKNLKKLNKLLRMTNEALNDMEKKSNNKV